MIFSETILPGAFIIQIQKLEDERGYFARTFCQNEFRDHGLNPSLAQCNISYNRKKSTLRGMHFQAPPRAEAKLVQCLRGSIYDVIIDLRADSPTFLKHAGVVLAAQEHTMIYVPEGFAHGFITLEDDTEVFYQMSEFYAPGFARGFLWNDPAFAIVWPAQPLVISERDTGYPNFSLEYLK